jgi:high-affinity Fe2+/Pb2+ permease
MDKVIMQQQQQQQQKISNNQNNKNSQSNQNKTLITSTVLAASNESIKLIGESIGITNLSDEGCRYLTSDLTFTIKSILLVIILIIH